MSLRNRLLLLFILVSVAMAAVALGLSRRTVETVSLRIADDQRKLGEAVLRREWTHVATRLAAASVALERVLRIPQASQAARELEQARLGAGASRAWLGSVSGPTPIETGEGANYRQLPQVARLALLAQGTGSASELVADRDRAALLVIVGRPGDPRVAALELSLDSRLAASLREVLGVDLVLGGLRGPGRAVAALGAAADPATASRLRAAMASGEASEGRADVGTGIEAIRLVRLQMASDVVLVAAFAVPPGRIATLAADTEPLLMLLLAVIAISGLAAAARLGSSWTGGILALDTAAREQIGRPGRYRPLVRKGRDELARLTQTFNAMWESVRQQEHRIRQEAYRDPITRLPTRSLFEERSNALLDEARGAQSQLSLLVLRVEQLRELTEAMGRQVGDRIMAELARRLRAVLRRTRAAGPDDRPAHEGVVIARTGTYEFSAMLLDCDWRAARNVAVRLSEVAIKPFRHDEQSFTISLRIGIASWPMHGSTIGDLMQSADYALLGAAADLSGVAVFDPEFETERERQLAMQSDLRRAIERRELHMVFQPKVGLDARSGLMAEALMRWIHPERGPQSPAEFIEFAEKTGFVSTLTLWAIGGALDHAAEWARDGLPLTISVNLSRRDLLNPEFPAQVVAALHNRGLGGNVLAFDIADRALHDAPAILVRNMELLARLGATFAVDDFGSGFGSLDELARLPLHALKIDPRYVATMVENPRAAIVVRAVIDLASAMGLKSVAEGVETAEQLQMLREMGCDQAQGYYFGRPLTREDFEIWVRHQAAKYGIRDGARDLRPLLADALSEVADEEPGAGTRHQLSVGSLIAAVRPASARAGGATGAASVHPPRGQS